MKESLELQNGVLTLFLFTKEEISEFALVAGGELC